MFWCKNGDILQMSILEWDILGPNSFNLGPDLAVFCPKLSILGPYLTIQGPNLAILDSSIEVEMS